MDFDKDKKTVTIKVDGESIVVPAGVNLVEAVGQAGVEVPHYCYHRHLSIAGNCRMCQLEVKGQSKLVIGCNTTVVDGMEVFTHRSSEKVREAQASTLEFLLVNHPLDCTVCDQSGHCKLQDYHYQFNLRPSSFDGQKVSKSKALPLGPNVILDAERCILCTRCVRFCREFTETCELGVFKRGAHSQIGVVEGRQLDNPFSGTVVDLCPVGALTHRKWRFVSRIWFTSEVESICPGCSTGCNVKVAVRDGQIVLVKARLNSRVNQEWLCDQGRYGFDRYLPKNRVKKPFLNGEEVGWEQVTAYSAGLREGKTLLLLSPDIHLEDYAILQRFVDRDVADCDICIPTHYQELTALEAKLMSPARGANYQGAEYVFGAKSLIDESKMCQRLVQGEYQNLLVVGDRAVSDQLIDKLRQGDCGKFKCGVGLLSDLDGIAASLVNVVLPVCTIVEQGGLLLNREMILQYAPGLLLGPEGALSLWEVINRLAASRGSALIEALSDYDRTKWYFAADSRLGNASISDLQARGVALR